MNKKLLSIIVNLIIEIHINTYIFKHASLNYTLSGLMGKYIPFIALATVTEQK